MRKPSRAARVLCAILTSGCASAGASWRGTGQSSRIEVFYATDRERRPAGAASCAVDPGPQPIRFGSERGPGSLSFGQLSVRLPGPRHLGEIPDYVERPACPSQVDPVYLAGPVANDEEQFADALSAAVASSTTKDVLVFVHGYDFPFDEAVLWAAQLKHDVGFEGVLVLYSWPSLGSRWAYAADLVNAEWTVPHLARFLDGLAAKLEGGRVHLLGHSMGSKSLLSALHAVGVERRDTPLPRFGQVILAAPDVDAGVFSQLVPPVVAIADRITVYVAADLALRISGWLFAHPRAGDSRHEPLLVEGVDTVDVTAVDDSRVRHDYFLANERVLADIFQLLAYRAPPQRRFRLFSKELHGLPVWQFRS